MKKKAAAPRVTKTAKVKAHLEVNKTITSLEAIKLYAATRLAAIICVMRKNGWLINSVDTDFVDKYGNKGTYAVYHLVSMPKSKAKK